MTSTNILTSEVFDNLYEVLLNEPEINDSNLFRVGIQNKHIDIMTGIGILQKIGDTKYKFIDTQRLYRYGKYMVTLHNYELAYKVFTKCLEIDSNFYKARFMIVYNDLIENKLDDVISNLALLEKTEFYKNEIYLYWILLSEFTVLPSEVITDLKTVLWKEVRLDFNDERYTEDEIKIFNYFRKSIYKRKFSYAIQVFNDINWEEIHCNEYILIIKKMLTLATNAQTAKKNVINSYMEAKDYMGLLLFLTEEGKKHRLSKNEKYIYNLLNAYSYICRTGNVPESTGLANDVFGNIRSNNYYTALSQCLPDSGPIKAILEEICQKIKVCYKEKQVRKIMTFLGESDLDSAIQLLQALLAEQNLTEYEYIFLQLLESASLDYNLYQTLLLKIGAYNHPINLDQFYELYLEAINNNNIEDASVYLQVLSYIHESEEFTNEFENLENEFNSFVNPETFISEHSLTGIKKMVHSIRKRRRNRQISKNKS